MRIILNSDVLYSNRPVSAGLPAHIVQFCQDAAGAGAILVVPRTTLLENRRLQEHLAQQSRTTLEGAAKTFERFGIPFPPFDPQAIARPGDLITVLRETGIKVEEEQPSYEDYRRAEERACLHLPPHPPDIKSDEMRDLVIWEVALRIAKRDGQAILLSRDTVHIHDRGSDEAQEASLHRVESFDDALVLLGRVSPSGALATRILQTLWSDLRGHIATLPNDVVLRRVADLAIVPDEAGRAAGTFRFAVSTADGLLSARIEILQLDDEHVQVDLTDLRLADSPYGDGQLTLSVEGELPTVAAPDTDGIDELRRLIQDDE